MFMELNSTRYHPFITHILLNLFNLFFSLLVTTLLQYAGGRQTEFFIECELGPNS